MKLKSEPVNRSYFMFDYTATYTDQYQLTMSQVYFHKGLKDETAIFDYFFRKLPFGGGYAIFAGLEDFLEVVDNLHFNEKDLEFLKKEGMDYVKIAASNQLDENVIKSLIQQNAPIDLFGVGTSLVTGRPDAALDGVYKLSYANKEPRLKLSETVDKVNLPGKKQVFRLLMKDGSFYGGEVVTFADETDVDIMLHPSDPDKSLKLDNYIKNPLLNKVIENGKRLTTPKKLREIAEFSSKQMRNLPEEFKRFDNPHIYKIGLSKSLKKERDRLVEHHKQKIE